jgi:hypothetical protein
MLEGVREKVDRWAGLNKLRSLIQQEEIIEELDRLQRNIEVFITAYHVRLHCMTHF